MCEFLHVSRGDEYLMHDWKMILCPGDVEEFMQVVRRSCASGDGYEHIVRMKPEHGHAEAYRWYMIRAAVLDDVLDGEPRWYCSATDIHDRCMETSTLENRLRFIA